MKKVLLISPVFFDYYKEIITELKNQKCDVDFIRDSANESNIYKAISRINKKLVKIPMNKYFNEQIKFIKNKKYDYVILIAGMTYSFDKSMIAKIKEIQNQAVFVMYQWDGEKNIPYVKDIHNFFDKILIYLLICDKLNLLFTYSFFICIGFFCIYVYNIKERVKLWLLLHNK